MKRSQGTSIDTRQSWFEDFSASSPTLKGALHHQWPGRYWSPATDRVEPTRKYCLIQSDGRAGEMLLDRFPPGGIKKDFAAFQGDFQLA